MKVEIESDLLDLAFTYLWMTHKEITAYNLCYTMEKILQWSEKPARLRKNKSRIVFKKNKIIWEK